MSTKQELVGAVVGYLKEVDPEEFSVENSGDRAEKLATGIIDRLDELEALNYTDEAETQDTEEPVEA